MTNLEIVQVFLTLITLGLMFASGYVFGTLKQSQKIIKLIDVQLVSLKPKTISGRPTKMASKIKNSTQK